VASVTTSKTLLRTLKRTGEARFPSNGLGGGNFHVLVSMNVCVVRLHVLTLKKKHFNKSTIDIKVLGAVQRLHRPSFVKCDRRWGQEEAGVAVGGGRPWTSGCALSRGEMKRRHPQSRQGVHGFAAAVILFAADRFYHFTLSRHTHFVLHYLSSCACFFFPHL